MKLSVSLPQEDVAFLDELVRVTGLASRSAALHQAVRMLRLPELEHDYEASWQEWGAAGEHQAWEATAADGVADAAR